jgi:ATP-dependent DNA ligase
MDKLYPETKPVGDDKSNLKSSRLLGSENELLNNYAAVPKKPTEKEVVELAKKAGDLEGNIELMKLWSEQSLTAQSNALSALDVRVNHAKLSMKNQQQFKKKMFQHSKDVAANNLANLVTQSNHDGFQRALDNASETIAI